jgi:hypothetical protein
MPLEFVVQYLDGDMRRTVFEFGVGAIQCLVHNAHAAAPQLRFQLIAVLEDGADGECCRGLGNAAQRVPRGTGARRMFAWREGEIRVGCFARIIAALVVAQGPADAGIPMRVGNALDILENGFAKLLVCRGQEIGGGEGHIGRGQLRLRANRIVDR